MKSITCPKCQHINDTENQTECLKCGIIYKRYQARLNKAFKQSIIAIGEKGLEHAREEFEKLAKAFPNIKAICISYVNAIELALREHSKANYETAQKIFTTLLEKQPDLYRAISPYLIQQQNQREAVGDSSHEHASETEEPDQQAKDTEDITEIKINLKECPACNKTVSINARTCPHCGEPLKNNLPFNNIPIPKILGILGVAIVSVGVFCPLISAPIVGSINYFQNGDGDGKILLIIAAVSLFLIYLNRAKYLTHTGTLNLIILGYTFYSFIQKKNELKAGLDTDLAGNPFKGLADMAYNAFQLQWGWVILILGSLLLIFAGYLQTRDKLVWA